MTLNTGSFLDLLLPALLPPVQKIGNKNSGFWKFLFRAFGSWMPAPKCLFSRILRALTEVLGRDIRANDPRMPAGCPSPKLSLWADLSFLKKNRRTAQAFSAQGSTHRFKREGKSGQENVFAWNLSRAMLVLRKHGTGFHSIRSFEKGLAVRGGCCADILCQRLRALFCTLFPMPPLGEGGHIYGELFWLF